MILEVMQGSKKEKEEQSQIENEEDLKKSVEHSNMQGSLPLLRLDAEIESSSRNCNEQKLGGEIILNKNEIGELKVKIETSSENCDLRFDHLVNNNINILIGSPTMQNSHQGTNSDKTSLDENKGEFEIKLQSIQEEVWNDRKKSSIFDSKENDKIETSFDPNMYLRNNKHYIPRETSNEFNERKGGINSPNNKSKKLHSSSPYNISPVMSNLTAFHLQNHSKPQHNKQENVKKTEPHQVTSKSSPKQEKIPEKETKQEPSYAYAYVYDPYYQGYYQPLYQYPYPYAPQQVYIIPQQQTQEKATIPKEPQQYPTYPIYYPPTQVIPQGTVPQTYVIPGYNVPQYAPNVYYPQAYPPQVYPNQIYGQQPYPYYHQQPYPQTQSAGYNKVNNYPSSLQGQHTKMNKEYQYKKREINLPNKSKVDLIPDKNSEGTNLSTPTQISDTENKEKENITVEFSNNQDNPLPVKSNNEESKIEENLEDISLKEKGKKEFKPEPIRVDTFKNRQWSESKNPPSMFNYTSYVNNHESLTDEQIEQQCILLTKEQVSCRFLQKKIDSKPYLAIKIFKRIKDSICELTNSPFGNYLVQKLLEYFNEETLEEFIQTLSLQFLNAGRDNFGVRVLQKLFQMVSSNVRLLDLFLANFNPFHCLILMKDQFGNFLIQKLITLLGSVRNQFLYEIIKSNFVDVAVNKHGTIVIQKAIEYGSHNQRIELIKLSIVYAITLAVDQYGYHILQYLIGQNNHGITKQLIEQFLTVDFIILAKQKYSAMVMEKCFNLCDKYSASLMVNRINTKENVLALLFDHGGNFVLQKAFAHATKTQYNEMIEIVKENFDQLKHFSHWGPKLAFKLSQIYPELNGLFDNSYYPEGNKNIDFNQSYTSDKVNGGLENNEESLENGDQNNKNDGKEENTKEELKNPKEVLVLNMNSFEFENSSRINSQKEEPKPTEENINL